MSRFIACSIVLPALFACGAAAPPPPSGDAGTTPPSLAGHWVSDCIASEAADGSTSYSQLDFDLADARWTLDYVVHGAPDCSAPLMTVHVDGPYALERPSDTVAGAWEARFAFDTKTVRPEVDAMRDFLNGLDGCGSAPFATGVAQSVYESGCPTLGQYPMSRCQADYDLVKLDGSDLRFGMRPADNDMCSADKRPTALGVANHRR